MHHRRVASGHAPVNGTSRTASLCVGAACTGVGIIANAVSPSSSPHTEHEARWFRRASYQSRGESNWGQGGGPIGTGHSPLPSGLGLRAVHGEQGAGGRTPISSMDRPSNQLGATALRFGGVSYQEKAVRRSAERLQSPARSDAPSHGPLRQYRVLGYAARGPLRASLGSLPDESRCGAGPVSRRPHGGGRTGEHTDRHTNGE